MRKLVVLFCVSALLVLSLALSAVAAPLNPGGPGFKPDAGGPRADQFAQRCAALPYGTVDDQGTIKPNDDVCTYTVPNKRTTSAQGYPIEVNEYHTMDYGTNDTVTGTEVVGCWDPATGDPVAVTLPECQP